MTNITNWMAHRELLFTYWRACIIVYRDFSGDRMFYRCYTITLQAKNHFTAFSPVTAQVVYALAFSNKSRTRFCESASDNGAIGVKNISTYVFVAGKATALQSTDDSYDFFA